MVLTNEEKKKIADAATVLMQRFCEFRMAEDRLNTMNGLAGSLLHMGMDKEMVETAMQPYMLRMKEAQIEFFKLLGIEESNKEFWEYNAKVEAAKRAPAQDGNVSESPRKAKRFTNCEQGTEECS